MWHKFETNVPNVAVKKMLPGLVSVISSGKNELCTKLSAGAGTSHFVHCFYNKRVETKPKKEEKILKLHVQRLGLMRAKKAEVTEKL